MILTAATDDDGRRLDRILRKALRNLPLSAIHRLLRQGRVMVNNLPSPPNLRVRRGDVIKVDLENEELLYSPFGEKGRRLNNNLPQILFEGEGLLILNKPVGLAVHGPLSLEAEVLSYLAPKLPESLSFRPGPLHRLDKMSSGIISFSTNLLGARSFSAMMRERRIKRFYLALMEGVVREAENWQDLLYRDINTRKSISRSREETKDEPLPGEGGDKEAFTRVAPLAESAGRTLILAEIVTGRTHQIRAQAGARLTPLLGDRKYGASSGEGFLLHGLRMEFPGDSPFPPVIEAPLPERFRKKILALFGDKADQFPFAIR